MFFLLTKQYYSIFWEPGMLTIHSSDLDSRFGWPPQSMGNVSSCNRIWALQKSREKRVMTSQVLAMSCFFAKILYSHFSNLHPFSVTMDNTSHRSASHKPFEKSSVSSLQALSEETESLHFLSMTN